MTHLPAVGDEEILEYVREIERKENEYHSAGGCVFDTLHMRTLREHLMRELFKLRQAKAHMYNMGIFMPKES